MTPEDHKYLEWLEAELPQVSDPPKATAWGAMIVGIIGLFLFLALFWGSGALVAYLVFKALM